jgi:hypothetical protein
MLLRLERNAGARAIARAHLSGQSVALARPDIDVERMTARGAHLLAELAIDQQPVLARSQRNRAVTDVHRTVVDRANESASGFAARSLGAPLISATSAAGLFGPSYA